MLGLGILSAWRDLSAVRRPERAPRAPTASAESTLAALPTAAPTAVHSVAARPTATGAAPASSACPADMVLIEGSFCPSLRYECARWSDDNEYRCAEYDRTQTCTAPLQPRRYCIDRHEWPNRVGELPRVMVSWNDAKAACAEVDKRLCRRSEWVLACEGPKWLPYPWGYERHPSPCNIDRPGIPADANVLIHGAPEDADEELARLWQGDRIGSHPDCVSGFGVYDLAGNVDEWTDNAADQPGTTRPTTLNGGYWGPVRDTCRLTTKSHGPLFRFYQAGFRCCRDPLDGDMPPFEPWLDPDPEGRP